MGELSEIILKVTVKIKLLVMSKDLTSWMDLPLEMMIIKLIQKMRTKKARMNSMIEMIHQSIKMIYRNNCERRHLQRSFEK